MAASRLGKTGLPALLLLFLVVVCLTGLSTAQIRIDDSPNAPRDPPLDVVTKRLLQQAVKYFGENSPSGRTYKRANIVAVQGLIDPETQQALIRLTLNLEPVCKGNEQSCPGESCTVDARTGDVAIFLRETIRCQQLVGSKPTEPEPAVTSPSLSLDREVQISADHNDRPFIAVRATQSDYCPGCPYELSPSLPGLMAFGEQALRSMDESGIGDFKHKLISIVRVTRAVPPGASVIRYQLLMEIGESSCLRTSLIELSECALQSNLPIELCLVTFEERPWQTGSRRITGNNCTDLLSTDNEVSASVDPANTSFFDHKPKPAANADDEDGSAKPEFDDQIAQEAQEVYRMPNMEVSTSPRQIVEPSIDKIEEPAKAVPHSKVVLDAASAAAAAAAGKETGTKIPEERLKEFDKFLEDFELPIKMETTSPKNLGEPVVEPLIVKERVEDKQADESTTTEATEKITELVDDAQKTQNPSTESNRSKRSITKTLEGNKAGIRKLAFKVVEMIDKRDEDNKKKHLIDVISVKQETKNHGSVYHMTIEVAPTDCRESEKSTECLDEVIPGPNEICTVDVSVAKKDPLLAPKLLYSKCKTKDTAQERLKRDAFVGAPSDYNKDDPEVLKFVDLGLRKFSDDSYGGSNELIIKEVKEVTRQVVAGLLYKIKVDIGESNCEKGVKDNCQLKGDVKQCTIEAWVRAWINDGKPEIKVLCEDNAARRRRRRRRRRSLRGVGYTEKMLSQARELQEEKLFREFINKYKRKYSSDEEQKARFEIFRQNLDMIEELQRNEQGTGRYGVTQFADLTKAEFKARHLGLKPSLRSENDIPLAQATIPDVELPAEYDWRHYNVVTPVKNQGSCGSCWAFSVTGNVEGLYAIKHGQLLSLSEQELVDCDRLDSGCNGGLPDTAYRAIEELGGLETETDYPYEAENEKCHFNKTMARVSVVSGVNITSNETQMAQWLVKNGPMSIGINANAMQFYMGGVSHPFHFLCNPKDLDHGVLIVGYGIKSYPLFKKKMPYWLIKNSWGERWGEQGYYRVYRGDGTCGVNQMVTSAVIA